MVDLTRFTNHAIRLIFYSIYPALEIYGYFIFSGLFAIDSTIFPGWVTVMLYIIYNLLIMLKIIFYLEIFIIEEQSTLELFPRTERSKGPRSFENINPYIVEDILGDAIDKIKICDICETYKPPRAHHCMVTNRCYLKYDHYCTFFNVCVGYHNYKVFYQFLVINFASCIFFLAIIGTDLFNASSYRTSIRYNYIVAVAVFFVVLLFITFQLVTHTILISRNETSVECSAINAYIEGTYVYNYVFQEGPMKLFVKSSDRRVLNPYNLGLRNNWVSVFGKSPLGWVMPVFTSLGNGLVFKTNDELAEEENV